MPFVPIRSKSVAEVVSFQIRELVSEDVLRPGHRLPSEREHCDRMRVSRRTSRERLKTLVSEKRQERRRGSGLSVFPHINSEPNARATLTEQHRAIARAICEEREDGARGGMQNRLDFVLVAMKKREKEALIRALADRRSLWEAEAASQGSGSI